MDDMGNIIIKRMSHCDVFIRGYDREANSISKDILDLSGQLEFEKSVKLFDMKKFQNSISKELRSSYPDRRRLENQCINVIAFVKDANDVMNLPVWCMVINIVALDMLKSKMPSKCANSLATEQVQINRPRQCRLFLAFLVFSGSELFGKIVSVLIEKSELAMMESDCQ